MDDSKEAKIRELCGFTGVSEQQAVFYLESSGWDVASAANTFFESGGHEEEHGNHSPDEQDFPVPGSGGLDQTTVGAPGLAIGSSALPTDRRGKGKSGSKGAGGSSKIKTFADLQNNQDDDSGSESDGPNEYYTGGEKSGMMVQDPNRPHRGAVDAIFNHARQQGARDGNSQDLDGTGSSRGGAFSGRGYTLSGEPPAAPNNEPAPTTAPSPPVVHTITFWRNGFTVDDGPLRHLEDPANRPFLESIHRGECPRELEPENRNTPINVNLVRKDEEWSPPLEPRYRAFAGVGRTLGASTDDVPAPLPQVPAPANPGNRSGTPSGQGKDFEVDMSKPSTSITVRLIDGTRLVARFNHHHTIGDLRQFITASRPGTGAPYGLYTGFPPKLLQNSEQTVEDAGLLNSVVIQKS